MALVIKIAPTLLILAISGYSVWPHLWPTDPPKPPQPAPPPEITASHLSPAVGTPHDHDPFLDPEVAQAKATGARRDAPPLFPGQKEKGASGLHPGSEAAGNDPRGRLTLNATYVQGRRCVAMINDRFYE
ncbi:MAG: hypothetical protein ACHRXM_40210, partial [Isosphaerales bacterium]